MNQGKINCWEYKKCGRAPGGKKAKEKGVCPASIDSSFDGINFGKNAGRFCWAVAGTCCGGAVQGTYAEKRDVCTSCDFYQLVQEEEGTIMSDQKFFSLFSELENKQILEKLTCKSVIAGDLIVKQGEVRDTAFIIQNGSCLIIVEKDNEFHPVGHRGRGDILGVESFLTGEPQTYHAEAETNMDLLIFDKKLFDDFNKENPGMVNFLTEIVADQFDSKRPVADRVIGKFIATDIIGRGGFSIVYKGLHEKLNMPVAIKMLRHNLAMDSEFQATFRNEAHIIASLDHENIIKIYDIEERFRTLFIIEELVAGESLRNLLERLGRITVKLAVGFLIQICSGLDYAHGKGIIHRDINPTNIFVKQNDRIKILDFGLACPIGTEDFATFGTAAYMAPEQIESEALDERTDIYSLGITAFEMVVGKKPFSSNDRKTLEKMQLECIIPDPSKLIPNLPIAFSSFIQKACCKDPTERYQNVSDVLKTLENLATELGLKGYDRPPEKFNMSSLIMAYKDQQELDFKNLMDLIYSKANELGIVLKSADFNDI